MVTITLAKDLYADIIKAMSALADEVKITLTADGLSTGASSGGMTVKAVDNAHVGMFSLEIPSSSFEAYDVEGTVEFGLDLDKAKEVSKIITGETVTMKYDEEKMALIFLSGNLRRKMGTLDISSMQDIRVPDMALTSSAEVPVDLLQKTIKGIGDISDHVTVSLSETAFSFAAIGDTDTLDMTIPAADLTDLTVENDAKSMYPLDYIARIVLGLGSETVKFEFDTDHPIRITSAIREGTIKYLIAPRIETD